MKSIVIIPIVSIVSLFAAKVPDLKQLDMECKKGNSQSCYDIGLIYDKADIVKYDPHKIVYYYDKACNGKIAVACYGLGILYDEGTNCKNKIAIDKVKAASAFLKGCEAGDKDSCTWIEISTKL